MLKVRFTTNGSDYRPMIYPPKHPWWCCGYSSEGYAVIVAYADSYEQVLDYWPDCGYYEVIEGDVARYHFTSRFPKPEWFNEV